MSECLFLSCTLLKLACSITQLACSSLLIVMRLLASTRALTRGASIANTLRVLIAHYVFIRVRHVHYLSSSNSSVKIGLENIFARVGGLYY